MPASRPQSTDLPAERAVPARATAWAVLVWVVAWVMLRLSLSEALKWDYGEQMLWSQQLAWGYGPQPPLYTWLQWGANALLGPSVLALALLKGVLMILTLLFWLLAARIVMPAAWAPFAALGTLLLPVSVWIGVRDVTHTLLVSCSVAAFWWALLRQLQRPTAGGFVALGVAVAAAVLSKYNAVLVIAAALLAAASLPAPRRALRAPGWLWTPLVAAALLAPHAAWVWSNWGRATAETLEKMQRGSASDSWLVGVLTGLGSLLPLLVATLLPWALALTWAFGAGVWRRGFGAAAAHRPLPPSWLGPLLARYVMMVLAGLLAMVLLGTTRFDGRWLHPLLACVPVLGFGWLVRETPGARARRRWWGLLTALAVLMLVLPAVDAWRDARRGTPERFNWPLALMARELRDAGYDGRSLIVADHLTLGGSLRIPFPHAPVVACDAAKKRSVACVAHHVQAARRAGQAWLLVAAEDEAPPAWWSAAAPLDETGPPLQQRALPYRGAGAGAAPMRFVFRWQPPPRDGQAKD